ncbi:arginine/serine-rich protein PNISR-like [Culicoides brevitarsis]|uniref:arginine/serine-rich protein PNISR-like n=1 Tax=Culicoides brevitarsis TaxID=469753 RepID=UPI00307C1748
MDHSQWAMSMNPAFYANTPNANVDWAQLAAQWIHMRETLPSDQLNSFPEAPPPPSISLLGHQPSNAYNKHHDEVKGEAPMEVEKDEDDVIPSFDTSVPLIAPQPPIIQQWNVAPPSNISNPAWRNPAWQVYPPPVNENLQQPPPALTKPPPLCPELQGYTTKNRFQRSPPKNFSVPVQENVDEGGAMGGMETLDAAKRKTLPAWIREGLEKMEREKQREEERIKMEEERKKKEEEKRKLEAEMLQELESTKVLRSKFDMDNSDEEDENEEDQAESVPVTPQKYVPPTRTPSPEEKPKTGGPVVIKSREQQMQELMMSVRKNLTEILLEVTNEEIKSIARETHSKMKSKVNRAQTLRKTALTSITGGLGLGIYGSESESSDDEDKSDKEDTSGVDSEAEIRESMKIKKAQFERVVEEIEEYLEREELAELTRKREWERKYGADHSQSRPNSDDSDDSSQESAEKVDVPQNNKYKSNESGSVKRNHDMGEPHHSSDYNSRSGARHKARVSRFSDPRDKVNAAELAAQAARLQKTETTSKKHAARDDAGSSNVRLDLNQFLRREVSKDMVELMKQAKRVRSRSRSRSTSSTNPKKSRSKSSRKSSKKSSSRRRSSSSSSSSSDSSSSSSSSSHRKHKKSKKSASRGGKKDKKRRSRSRSRSRSSHRSSGKSYSRDRYRDRR